MKKNSYIYLIIMLICLMLVVFIGVKSPNEDLFNEDVKELIHEGELVSKFELSKYYGDYEFESIIQTSDGGYIAVGHMEEIHSERSTGLVVKYDKDFNIEWTKGCGIEKDYYLYSVVETTDNNYIVGGQYLDLATNSRYGFLYKYDENGQVLWKEDYNYGQEGLFNYIIPIEDGGFIAIYKHIFTSEKLDIEVVKYNKYGKKEIIDIKNEKWFDNLNKSITDIEELAEVIKIDSGFIAYGLVKNNGIYNDIIIKCNNKCIEEWRDEPEDIELHSLTSVHNGIIGTGYTFIKGIGSDAVIIKYNINGDETNRLIYGTDDKYDSFNKAIQTEDGIIAVGQSEDNAIIVKFKVEEIDNK